jgi:Fe-Mn family superoxide dismutase
MKKREFLKTAGILGAGVIIAPGLACSGKKSATVSTEAIPPPPPPVPANKIFELPPLGYANNALEPVIDALTMEIHHDKHHGAYVSNLNKAVAAESNTYGNKEVEEILALLQSSSAAALRNNAGGHYNHSQFWNWIAPGSSKAMDGALMKAIITSFGNYDEFVKQFSEAAKTRFGSGWAWLSVDGDKKLFISSTPNQDNPLMKNIVEKPGTPILGIDVWEHAYYLNYQNRRPDYITAFMGIVNWDYVGRLYAKAITQ